MLPPVSYRDRGFTLIELLVAMAIFVIMIAFLGQLMSNTSASTNASKGRVSADDQARFALDRIGQDLLKLSKRPDLDYKINKQGGNDDFYFYCEVAGLSDDNDPHVANNKASGISLVGYRISSKNKLERYTESLTWDNVSFLTYGTDNNVNLDSTINKKMTELDEKKYHVLCDGVFRLEVKFLLRDGTYSDTPFLPIGSNLLPAIAANDVGSRRSPESAGSPTICVGKDSAGKSIWRGLGWRDVSAVIVTIVLIDDGGRKIVSETALSGLGNAFGDTAPTVLPMDEWTQLIKPGFGGIPNKAVAGVRVYQRAFYLNTL